MLTQTRKKHSDLKISRNIFDNDNDYPNHFKYKPIINERNIVVSKKYNDGIIERFDSEGKLTSIYYPEEKVTCIFDKNCENKIRFESDEEDKTEEERQEEIRNIGTIRDKNFLFQFNRFRKYGTAILDYLPTFEQRQYLYNSGLVVDHKRSIFKLDDEQMNDDFKTVTSKSAKTKYNPITFKEIEYQEYNQNNKIQSIRYFDQNTGLIKKHIKYSYDNPKNEKII
ncbi:MAG: hypothetical protein WJU30_00108 [Candidatus Phytoplasma pruni]